MFEMKCVVRFAPNCAHQLAAMLIWAVPLTVFLATCVLGATTFFQFIGAAPLSAAPITTFPLKGLSGRGSTVGNTFADTAPTPSM